MVFSTIMHHVDVDFLREAYRRTRKDATPGADGVTAAEYALNLEENLQNLYERMRGGRYEGPPVLRAWLDKEDGSKRPIGVPQFEDKIVQRAALPRLLVLLAASSISSVWMNRPPEASLFFANNSLHSG